MAGFPGNKAVTRRADQVINLWLRREEIQTRLKEEKTYHQHGGPLPLITISRDQGSGGGKVAEMLAHKLGFDLIDKEFLEYIAQRADVRREVVGLVDEKTKHNVFEWIEQLIKIEELSHDEYFRHLLQVVSTIAKLGGAITVGRGCNFIVEPARALRVRIVCPLEQRIKNVVRDDKLEPRQAESLLLESDKQRSEFIKKWFKQDINHAGFYDICLNTQFLDSRQITDFILKAYEQKFNLSLNDIIAHRAPKPV